MNMDMQHEHGHRQDVDILLLDQRGRPRTLFFEGFVEELAEVRKIGGSA
jgi:hypothetical protein